MIVYPFEAGGIVTRMLAAGDKGPVILLLHGFTSRADRWRQTVADLAARGYRVFAPDLPGHGFASKSTAFDHSVVGYRDFVIDVLDRLGVDRASLVGASLGGHVLAAVAKQIPDRVDHLVMIGSMGLEPLPAERVAKIRAGLSDMSLPAMRARLLSVFSDPDIVTDELVKEDVLVNTSPGAEESLGKFGGHLASGYNDHLALPDLVALDGKIPLLLLWGSDDKSVPVEVAQATRERMPHARFAIMPGINHTPYIENPALFQQIVLDFLQNGRGISAAGVTYR